MSSRAIKHASLHRYYNCLFKKKKKNSLIKEASPKNATYFLSMHCSITQKVPLIHQLCMLNNYIDVCKNSMHVNC